MSKRPSDRADAGRTAPDPWRSVFELINEAKEQEFVDLEALVATIGIDLDLHPYDAALAGTITRPHDRWVIGVNAAHTLTRRRFTIAHAIGHYVMHRDLLALREGVPGVADARNYQQPAIDILRNPHILPHHETEANRIAATLLMGTEKMRRLMAEGLDADQIAPLIGCAPAAVRIRIEGLAEAAA